MKSPAPDHRSFCMTIQVKTVKKTIILIGEALILFYFFRSHNLWMATKPSFLQKKILSFIFILQSLAYFCCRHVDEGDQGVNDAKWLQREAVLVTVSGDGRYKQSP